LLLLHCNLPSCTSVVARGDDAVLVVTHRDRTTALEFVLDQHPAETLPRDLDGYHPASAVVTSIRISPIV
jgi:hypothetical protein